MVEAYVSSTAVLSTKIQITKKEYVIPNNDVNFHLPYPRLEAVKNYMNIIDIFNNLKSNSAKEDKVSYKYFEKNKSYEEDKFLYKTTLYLVGTEAQYGQVSCGSSEVKILGNSHKNLMDYYTKNKKDLKFGEKGTIEILTSMGIRNFTLKQCTNTPALKEYNEYFIEKVKRLDRFKN